jgi:hypothetical protein
MNEEHVSRPPVADGPVSPPWRSVSRMDVVLAVLVVVFAFLAASFAVRNSDFWLHLATGRLLAHGDYVFGSDPFCYTTQGVYWANHAWLFDLGLYAGYQTLGGAGLVILKALLVALTAVLMLRSARGNGPFWVSAAIMLVALLAMSQRLFLQPASLSLMLLAACLCLLRAGGRAALFLPLLMILWVNLDSWFLLGPLLVALFVLGKWLTPSSRRDRQLPLWLVPTCLIACLVNPHHVHALSLPWELSPAVLRSEFPHDPRFSADFLSPWHLAPLGPAGGYKLSAGAFFLLLGLSILSFAVNWSALRSWRAPVWLAFALLAAWQVRLVPFFAVVAGPITGLNLREQLPEGRLFTRFGTVGVLVLGLALCALTWPGWLQGFQRHERQLAWTVHTDPSLRRVAETLANWRASGELPPETHVLATHPDVAHYCAWFSPGEKNYLDSRLGLHASRASDYRQLCAGVDPNLRGSDAVFDWPRARKESHLSCLVLYDPDLRRLGPALHGLSDMRSIWKLLRVDGQAVVAGFAADPEERLAIDPFDPEKLAFTPATSAGVPPVPGDGASVMERDPQVWDRFLVHSTGTSGEGEAAAVSLALFLEGFGEQRRQQHVLSCYGAGLVGLSFAPTNIVTGLVELTERFTVSQLYLSDMKERSPALLLLAVRMARRAVAAHPDDAEAWLVLARAYLDLSRTTVESVGSGLLPLSEVRRCQATAALLQAVRLRPNLTAAHEFLANLYDEINYLDLALLHRSRQLELVRHAGRLPGEDESGFSARLERLEKAVDEARNTVETNQNRFVVHSQGLAAKPLDRARLALELGLAGQALDEVLLRSQPDLYGVEGVRLVLELFLRTGRVAEAREVLDRSELRHNPSGLGEYDLVERRGPEQRFLYRFPAFDWFDLCTRAAVGDYDRATGAIDRLATRLEQGSKQLQSRLNPALAGWVTTEWGTGFSPVSFLIRIWVRRERDQVMAYCVMNEFVPVEAADLRALGGVLFLERGDPESARAQFLHADVMYRAAAASAPALPGAFLTKRYLGQLEYFAGPR